MSIEQLTILAVGLLVAVLVVGIWMTFVEIRRSQLQERTNRMRLAEKAQLDVARAGSILREHLSRYIKGARLNRLLDRHIPLADVVSIDGAEVKALVLRFQSSGFLGSEVSSFLVNWGKDLAAVMQKVGNSEATAMLGDWANDTREALLLERISKLWTVRDGVDAITETTLKIAKVRAAQVLWARLVSHGDVGSARIRRSQVYKEASQLFKNELFVNTVIVSEDEHIMMKKVAHPARRRRNDQVQLVHPLSGMLVTSPTGAGASVEEFIQTKKLKDHLITLSSASLTDEGILRSLDVDPIILSLLHDSVNDKVNVLGYVHSEMTSSDFPPDNWVAVNAAQWTERSLSQYLVSSQAKFLLARVSHAIASPTGARVED